MYGCSRSILMCVLRASARLTLFSHYGFSFDVWCLVSLVRRRVVVCEPRTQSNRAQQHKRAEAPFPPSFPRHLHRICWTRRARRLFRARTRAAFWKSRVFTALCCLLLNFYVLHTYVRSETFIWPSSKVFGAAHHQLLFLLKKRKINEIRLKWERTRRAHFISIGAH